MNRENAHEYLPLVQAISEGKTVQVQGGDGNWYNSRLINTPPRRYRIKPEPRTFEVWHNRYTGSIKGYVNPSQDDYSCWELLRVQEV